VHIKQILSSALVCLLAVSLVQGQAVSSDEIRVASQQFTPEQAGTIRVESTLVPVNVVVRDANGKPVGGLTKDDFQLFDQGKPQPITQFSIETAAPPPPTLVPTVISTPTPPVPPPPPPPRYVGMYFDDINLKPADVTFVRKAAEGFVRKNLEPYDHVGIFTSSTTVTLNFTQDQKKILDTLETIASHYKGVEFGAMPCPRMDAYQAFQIEQFQNEHSDATDLAVAQAIQCNPGMSEPDAMRLVETLAATTLSLSNQFARDSLGVLGDIIRYMAKMPGKRMLVMCSTGFFAKSDSVQKDQDKMIDAALHAGIVINTLDAKALAADWLGGDPADGPPIVISNSGLMSYADELASDERDVRNDPLSMLAQSTGGKFFHNGNDLEGDLVAIASVPDVSYTIAFAPDALKDNGVYHTLKVTLTNKKGLKISARPGYFAPAKEKAIQVERLDRMNSEVMSSDVLNGVPASVTTQIGKTATNEPVLKVAVHVNIRGFPFRKEDKFHVDRIVYVTALFDAQGKFLAGVEGIMDMRLQESTLAQLVRDGANAELSLQAPPGNYKLREVVQEVAGGRFSTINQDVHIE